MSEELLGFAYGDTETTGLSFLDTDVIQAAFIFEDDDFNHLGSIAMEIMLPDVYVWEKEAAGVHKIPEEYAKTNGIPQPEACDLIVEEVKKAYGSSEYNKIRLVGANSYFDYVMLQNMFERCGRKRVPFSYRLIDVNQLGYYLGVGSKLNELVEHYGTECDMTKKHNALYDARLHRDVFHDLFATACDHGLKFV